MSNAFIISPSAVSAECIYTFVVLNDPEKGPPTYYILHGREMLANQDKYWPKPDEKLPGTAPKFLLPHKDAWSVFKTALDDLPSTADSVPKITQTPQ